MRRQPERVEQRQMRALLIHVGAKVYTLGTTRKRTDKHKGTMQSPGLPDLIAFVPVVRDLSRPTIRMSMSSGAEILLVIEAKAPKGKRSAAQDTFASHCDLADVAYLVGGFAALVSWLLGQGLLEGDSSSWRIPRRRLMAEV